jgi:hypothetical protein
MNDTSQVERLMARGLPRSRPPSGSGAAGFEVFGLRLVVRNSGVEFEMPK